MTLWIAGLSLCGIAGWLLLRLLRPLHERPEDQSAIETFAGQSGYERVVIFAIGACIGGFIFAGGLHSNLSPPVRPLNPEPALGYTYLLKTKHGGAYGTYFEHLAVAYGIWVTWGLGVAISLFSWALGITSLDREVLYRRNGWQFLTAVIVSYLLYYAIWRAFSL